MREVTRRQYTTSGAVKHPEHLDIKQFAEEGKLKARMYRDGFVPLLDKAPHVDIKNIDGKRTYAYTITMEGVRPSRLEAREMGWDIDNYEGKLGELWVKSTTGTKFARLWNRSGLR